MFSAVYRQTIESNTEKLYVKYNLNMAITRVGFFLVLTINAKCIRELWEEIISFLMSFISEKQL